VPDEQEAEFCLEIRFPPNSERPERVFRAMTDLIEACHALDNTLADSIGAEIQPVLLLERVTAGSLRTWLRTGLESIDDEALKKLGLEEGRRRLFGSCEVPHYRVPRSS
jgi:hypothetical protein